MFVLILALLFFPLQESVGSGDEIPAWTKAPAEPNVFVVETEEFSTHFAAAESLLPAVRTDVIKWAVDKWGSDSMKFVETIPLDDFRNFVHEDQETIHQFRREYDPEKAKRLGAEYDDFFQGYVRVKIPDEFLAAIDVQMRQSRLQKRLCGALVMALLMLGSMGVLWIRLYMGRVSRGLYIGRLRWIAWGLLLLLIAVCYGLCVTLF